MDLRRFVHELIHRQSNEVAEHRSTTGRMPVMAAPTPMPAMPASEIGGSITRFVPILSLGRKALWTDSSFRDIFADDEDRRIAAHLFGQRLVNGFAKVRVGTASRLLWPGVFVTLALAQWRREGG